MNPHGVLRSRWWTGAVLTVIAVCGVILLLDGDARGWAGGVALGVFLVAFLTLGRRAHDGNRHAVALIAVAVLTTGALVSVQPSLAVFQAIAMPMSWVLTRTRRAGITANAFVAGAAGTGFFVSLGPTGAAVTAAGLTVLFSFAGSVALGLWIWRIAEYGDERARLLDELTAAQEELRVLHRDAGVTEERERLARELHDTIAQSLAGVVLLAQRARRELAAGTLADPSLALLEDAARDALTETRTLVAGAAPVELGGGLTGALELLAERFRRESGVTVSVSVALDGALDRDSEVVLLRCAQEALANVRKHAGASHVTIGLSTDGDSVVLRVADDGVGLDPAHIPDGFGLSGLRARLALAGGTLALDGDGGTTLVARLPRGGAA